MGAGIRHPEGISSHGSFQPTIRYHVMNARPRLTKVMLLTGSMVFVSGAVIGALSYLQGPVLVFVWLGFLVLSGFAIRRLLWPRRFEAWLVTAGGFLLFSLLQLVLSLVFNGKTEGISESLWMGVWFSLMYLGGFWLPFAVGILIGGFRRKKPPVLPATTLGSIPMDAPEREDRGDFPIARNLKWTLGGSLRRSMGLILTLVKGMLLAGGMVLLMGFAIGASGYLYEAGKHSYAAIPYATGMVVLSLLGFILRRWVCPERKLAWKITGAGFLCFMLLQLALGLVTTGSRGLVEAMDSVCMVMGLYVLCFWLPFAIGVLIGGFRLKAGPARSSEQPAVI
jgi:hypothetical protein